MLIESYNLRIDVSNHSVQEFEYEAIAELEVNMAEVLPYLNATLRNGIYLDHGPAFSWRKGDHNIGFWSDRIAVDHLESREQAKEIIEELVKLVNDIWERRGEIEPDTVTRENLQPLELYKLLPKTNCKLCGDSGCFSFALKVAAGQMELTKCEPLYKDAQFKQHLAALESLLRTKRTLI